MAQAVRGICAAPCERGQRLGVELGAGEWWGRGPMRGRCGGVVAGEVGARKEGG